MRHARLGWMHLASMRSEPHLEATVTDAVLPGFDSVGIDTDAAREWIAGLSLGA